MLKMGFNIGTSDMKRLLEENERQMSGVRSWKQLFGSAGQSYSAQNAAITGSYSDTIAQAYKANMAQNDAIMSAGLNLGATKELVENNRAALHSAYQTYIQNYEQAVSTNAQNYMATVDAYNKDLTARAENFSKLYNYAYKYLSEELANTRYAKSEGGIAEGTSWLANNALDWLYDKELGTVISWDSLSEQLVDQNAELTDKGREFFDAMFNARPEGYITSGETDEWATRSFDSWLGDTDAELRDWYVQGDAYNYNKYGTNLGTAKTLLGMESTDTSYKASDYTTLADFDQFTTGFKGTNAYTQLTSDVNRAREHMTELYKLYQEGNLPSTNDYFVAERKYRDELNKLISMSEENATKALELFERSVGEEAARDYEIVAAQKKIAYAKSVGDERIVTYYDELVNMLQKKFDAYKRAYNLSGF